MTGRLPSRYTCLTANRLVKNPSITSSCGNFNKGQSYCLDGSAATTSSTNTPPPTTTTSTPPSTTTSAGNSVQTPQPTQGDMVGNCNSFHYIYKGNTCGQIPSYHSITQEQFARWNPKVGKDCTGLVADAYACVGVIQDSTPTPTPTSTTPSNGVQTPQPTQPDMVKNCNSFHYIYKGNTCDQIASYHSITREQFARWNPRVGADCSGLWVDTYACVGVIGEDHPTPTPTTPSNGVQTPQPTQPDMVKNCNKFHYISKGNTCDQVTSYQSITQEQFARWNPKVGMDCSGLWADTYACVGVIGEDHPTPTPTAPSNGIQTPQPTQGNMVKNCNQFHYIYKGNTCAQITSYHHISQHDFATWNPLVGEQCAGLWADAYACVGVE